MFLSHSNPRLEDTLVACQIAFQKQTSVDIHSIFALALWANNESFLLKHGFYITNASVVNINLQR